MEMIANSSSAHSSKKSILNCENDSKQVCELFEKVCAVEEKNPLAQGFEPNIVNCNKSSKQTGDPKAPVDNIFVRLARAGALDFVSEAARCRKLEEDVEEAARFAVEEYNKIEVHHLELKWRIASGTVYYLELEATNGSFFEAEVKMIPRDPPVFCCFQAS